MIPHELPKIVGKATHSNAGPGERCFGSLVGDVELIGGLFGAQPVGFGLQHIALALGKLVIDEVVQPHRLGSITHDLLRRRLRIWIADPGQDSLCSGPGATMIGAEVDHDRREKRPDPGLVEVCRARGSDERVLHTVLGVFPIGKPALRKPDQTQAVRQQEFPPALPWRGKHVCRLRCGHSTGCGSRTYRRCRRCLAVGTERP
jgi:hypothetical protein